MNRVSVLLGVLLIVFVIGSYLVFVPGHLVMTQVENKEAYSAMLIEMIVIGGIVAPIIEEIMFRGILMKYIEHQTNIYLALIVTSILFGMVHVLNGLVTGMSLILLVVAVTTAGLMYGLAAYFLNTVWASIVIHMIWNLSAVMTITNQKIEYGVVQYMINTKNPLITGGTYGMDASLISIIGYMSIILVLLIYSNRSKHRKDYNDM
ncbi:lysostaphin resistance A-like protein [Staphylococcus simulans]